MPVVKSHLRSTEEGPDTCFGLTRFYDASFGDSIKDWKDGESREIRTSWCPPDKNLIDIIKKDSRFFKNGQFNPYADMKQLSILILENVSDECMEMMRRNEIWLGDWDKTAEESKESDSSNSCGINQDIRVTPGRVSKMAKFIKYFWREICQFEGCLCLIKTDSTVSEPEKAYKLVMICEAGHADRFRVPDVDNQDFNATPTSEALYSTVDQYGVKQPRKTQHRLVKVIGSVPKNVSVLTSIRQCNAWLSNEGEKAILASLTKKQLKMIEECKKTLISLKKNLNHSNTGVDITNKSNSTKFHLNNNTQSNIRDTAMAKKDYRKNQEKNWKKKKSEEAKAAAAKDDKKIVKKGMKKSVAMKKTVTKNNTKKKATVSKSDQNQKTGKESSESVSSSSSSDPYDRIVDDQRALLAEYEENNLGNKENDSMGEPEPEAEM